MMEVPSDGSPRHESEGSRMDVIFISLIVLSVLMLLTSIVGYGIHWAFLKFDHPKFRPLSPLAQMHRLPPEPRLQVDDAADLSEFRQAEENILNSYGWVDARGGIVRIPIERAVDLVAERGLPSRKGGSK